MIIQILLIIYLFIYIRSKKTSPFIYACLSFPYLLSENSVNAQSINLNLTSPDLQEIRVGEFFYIPLLIENKNEESISSKITIQSPEGWTVVLHPIFEVQLAENSSTVKIFSIKTSEKALAGIHELKLINGIWNTTNRIFRNFRT